MGSRLSGCRFHPLDESLITWREPALKRGRPRPLPLPRPRGRSRLLPRVAGARGTADVRRTVDAFAGSGSGGDLSIEES